MNSKVQIIPPANTNDAENPKILNRKLKVAAYARVSTGSEEQATSFTNQVNEWTKRIQSNPNYEFVKVYTDEGISGTSAKNRVGFQQMIEDAKCGKIDLILCKSISRFARNTLLSIKTLRELKEYGVNVYFDNEGIYSLDQNSEMLFTILSSIAQEESRHISENVNWTFKKKMAEGMPFCNTSRFLGYDKNNDKTQLIINKDEAETIKLIFNLYDSGYGCQKIANELEKRGLLTGAGAKKWHTGTVIDILKNEKYVGDLLLQKTFTSDYLGHVRKSNNGEKPKYLVKNAHEAIISRELYDRVQSKLKINSLKNLGENKDKNKFANKYPLSSMLLCLDCGSTYKRRLWNSKHNTARKFLFQCTSYVIKDENGERCHTKPVSEVLVEEALCDAINNVYLKKSRIFATVSNLLRSTFSTDKIMAQEANLQKQKQKISEDIDDLIEKRRNTDSLDLKEKIDAEYHELSLKYDGINAKLSVLREQELNSTQSQQKLNNMLSILSKKKLTRDMLTKDLLEVFMYKVIVCSSNEIVIVIAPGAKMSKDEFVSKRKEIASKKPIYESSITALDPLKNATLKYKVVLI